MLVYVLVCVSICVSVCVTLRVCNGVSSLSLAVLHYVCVRVCLFTRPVLYSTCLC